MCLRTPDCAELLVNFCCSCHIFYSQRVVDIPDGKPKWSEMNKKSDLIEDSPPEEIKKRKREQEEEAKNGDGEEEKKPKKD